MELEHLVLDDFGILSRGNGDSTIRLQQCVKESRDLLPSV